MKRRNLLLGAAALATAPLLRAQTGRVARIGILATAPTAEDIAKSAFLIKLRELGWEEKRNLRIERRFAPAPPELAKAAREMAALKLDAVYAPGAPAIRAAKQEITAIPVVFFSVGDPVGSGWVKNLARPESNLTGVAGFARDLLGKRIALLKEAVPALKRLAVLGNPANVSLPSVFHQARERGLASGIELRLFEVSSAETIETVFAAMAGAQIQGVIEVPDPVINRHHQRIAELALHHRLPAAFEVRQFPDAGGLMSYGADYEELARRAAAYIDRILRGAKPGDLPVEFPTKFEMVVNLKSARALGLKIPQSLLLRADRVIE
jgi:putative ABC transport system substrate-binding protein